MKVSGFHPIKFIQDLPSFTHIHIVVLAKFGHLSNDSDSLHRQTWHIYLHVYIVLGPTLYNAFISGLCVYSIEAQPSIIQCSFICFIKLTVPGIGQHTRPSELQQEVLYSYRLRVFLFELLPAMQVYLYLIVVPFILMGLAYIMFYYSYSHNTGLHVLCLYVIRCLIHFSR